jgi:hypothetical protein
MMNNKVNIFEELNKMKNLIHTKAGTVISEQPAQTVDQFVTQFLNSTTGAMGTNLQSIKSILEKIPDKNTFILFWNKIGEKSGQSFSKIINLELNPEEANQALLFAKIIKDRFNVDFDPGVENGVFKRKFKLSNWNMGSATNAGTPANAETPAATNLSNRQKNINFNYCSVKNGKIENTKSGSNGMAFNEYVSTYKVTATEIAEAKKTCPNVVVAPPAPAGPTPTQRFATTATSLGIQNPKMDVATLQTILNTLNQGGSGLTESKNSVNEELNKMKYILGYQRGRVISEQQGVVLPTNDPLSGLPIQSRTINLNQTTTDTNTQAQPAATQQAATQPAATPKDLITQIQTVLKDKYQAQLGKFGPKGDGVDGKWGNLTQIALDNALKSVADLKQRRETETQQTTTQDTAIQQAAEKGRMEVPQTNNLPTQKGIQQRPAPAAQSV